MGVTGHEIQILSLVEREGPVKSRFLDHKKVKEVIGDYIHPESRLVTDKAHHYKYVVKDHGAVDHGRQRMGTR